jgi:MSHA biogenesis protein MshI
MAQQINLYNPALRWRREWMTLTNLALVAILFALVLAGVGGASRWQASRMKAEAVNLEARLVEARVRLAQLTSSPQAVGAKEELASLQQQLAARREVLAALQAGLGKNEATAGFADYLRGLARQTVGGLWLTGFSVAQGGVGIEIRGRMTVADALPDYIRRLNAEKPFQGRQFVSLNVERTVGRDGPGNDARTPFNTFVLTSLPSEPSGKDKGAPR